jgi:uncharacterized iron-regulated membrane protein
MRKVFWRLHSVVGLFAGLALVVVGLSGSVLVFHEEIDALLRPSAVRVEPTEEGRLAYAELLRRVEAQLPEYAITGWDPKFENPRAADGAYVIAHGESVWRYITVDPYRGTVLSGPELYATTLKGWMLDLHYTFFLHDAGVAITGLLGLALCFLGISGVWLYRRFWKTLFRLRLRASLRLLSGDVHRLVGVFSVGFNLLLGGTGAYWNLSHIVEHFIEEELPPEEEFQVPGRLYPENFDLDAIVALGPDHIKNFETHYISLPWAPDGSITLWGKAEDASFLRSRHGSWISFSADREAPLGYSFSNARDITVQPFWKQAIDAMEPLHYGDFGGLTVKVFWASAGFAPAVLAFSGMTIWWQRRRPRRSTPS